MKSKTPRLGYPPFPAVSELYLSYQWGLSRGNSGECREEMSGGEMKWPGECPIDPKLHMGTWAGYMLIRCHCLKAETARVNSSGGTEIGVAKEGLVVND